MWQEIIVYSIGLLTLLYIAVKVIRFFQSIRKPEAEKKAPVCSECHGCTISIPTPKGPCHLTK